MKTLTDEEYELLVARADYRIPKPPVFKKIDALDTIAIICPKCKKVLPSFTRSCCPMCGQLIDG